MTSNGIEEDSGRGSPRSTGIRWLPVDALRATRLQRKQAVCRFHRTGARAVPRELLRKPSASHQTNRLAKTNREEYRTGNASPRIHRGTVSPWVISNWATNKLVGTGRRKTFVP